MRIFRQAIKVSVTGTLRKTADSGFAGTAILRAGRTGTKLVKQKRQTGAADVADPRELRLRVYVGDVIAMGPGKADLLAAIAGTGSISGAGRALGISYKRCWDLVETMNANFAEPLVATAAGGSSGGGAVLTALGEEVLADYQAIVEAASRAISPQLQQFRRHLK